MRNFRSTLFCLLSIRLLVASHCIGGEQVDSEKIPAPDKSIEYSRIESVVKQEIEKGNIPGAVVLIGNQNEILYQQAFGCRSLLPEATDLEKGCIFDIASLSKPVSTAACIHLLIDRGELALDTKVADLIPEFGRHQKEAVQIKHLLSHTSGLPAYTSASGLEKEFGLPCRDKVLEKICSLKPKSEPGETFRYSCLGYIVLGRIVEIVSGEGLDRFAYDNIFEPLGMNMTSYNPDIEPDETIAPTGKRDGQWLRGQVHDPLAALMAGVSGNAGVFSTAEDLSRYCTMLLNGGQSNGRQILSRNAVSMLTQEQLAGRAYGFDVSSSYASIKGDGFSPSTFCHSGYTGTSIVCDPQNNIYVIILTNRVHPDDKGSVSHLRKQIATITAELLVHSAAR